MIYFSGADSELRDELDHTVVLLLKEKGTHTYGIFGGCRKATVLKLNPHAPRLYNGNWNFYDKVDRPETYKPLTPQNLKE